MKLSTKGRYAMVALTDLAVAHEGALLSLAEISKRQDISLSYLEQLFVKLRRAGLVESVKQNAPRSAVPVDGLPDELRPLYVQPVVSADKVRSLFLRYNFLKHRAEQTRKRFAHAPARARDLDVFEQDIVHAARVRGGRAPQLVADDGDGLVGPARPAS